ncbi:uncharacterized protein B0H18DRAFT_1123930 [Fomitopsis serialis]|uniref:uncharacterized protein n=1 Tax=Fomitopsis serialis TaxID=139415 RepID=UPI002008D7B5|nr:uncharacterized protein B0H18DRAFT_1123930 [Neoantrodia serialis]KAH9916858.1 hypothetical protein B0H18DRAFT_1123930 [Neoantrodia serialis]
MDALLRSFNKKMHDVPPDDRFNDYRERFYADVIEYAKALLKRISVAGFSLRRVVSNEYMAHLGRPAFGRLWDVGVREELIDIAARLLLNSDHLDGPSTDAQTFACLSHRLALPLVSVTPSEQRAEQEQIQHHLRICLAFDPTSGDLVSVAPSEPLLAEAAYYAMRIRSMDTPQALRAIFDAFSIGVGQQGDVVLQALLIAARDAAVGDPLPNGLPRCPVDEKENRRLMSSTAFFRKLFKPFEVAFDHEGHSYATASERHQAETIRRFHADFQNCNVHFNHFISVQPDVLRAKYLLALLARGAAPQCASHGCGVDAVLTMTDGFDATSEALHLVLFKTTQSRRTEDLDGMFAAMDPYDLGIWDAGRVASKPLVRILFAPFVEHDEGSFSIERRTSLHGARRDDESTTVDPGCYDIVVTGLSSTILGPIETKDVDSWDALLHVGSRHADVGSTISNKSAMSHAAQPGMGSEAGHWRSWVDGVV